MAFFLLNERFSNKVDFSEIDICDPSLVDQDMRILYDRIIDCVIRY